ncbi:MAG: cupin domain-containing protein, partial [Proteobacteria bacterium]|nr:cupin domain-containing protein [Pseudomonadota bacterium]
GVATIDGVEQVLTAYDSTYVPAGVPHCFRNASDNPFVMLFVYPSAYVERHFTESGTMDWHGRPPAEAHGDD